MVMRMTRIPQELFSASVRSNDQFYGAVAKYVSIEELMSISGK